MLKNFDCKIVLENGREFYGCSFGARCEAICEIVLNSSMVGYQEIISDPSYTGQTVLMTYSLIGNYGITDEDFESKNVSVGGLIVREYNDIPSNFRYTKTLSEVLEENNVPGISGVDTRTIAKIIRDEGSQRVMITSINTSKEEALKKIKSHHMPKDLVAQVSCKKIGYVKTFRPKFDVVVVDCGIKLNIIREFSKKGCNVTIVPYNTSAEEIMNLSPDGLFISNGPGNPEDVPEVIEIINKLKGKIPMFGIGLGYQVICLSYGAEIYKMKFGHRGGYPVKNLATDKIEITSQNHSYAVNIDSLRETKLKVTHVSLPDNTVEGIENKKDKVFAVQYQPESAPGPQDSSYLFDNFINMMNE